MKTAPMRALIWNDFRISRPVLIIGFVLLLAPYAITLLTFTDSPHWTSMSEGAVWSMLIEIAAYMSLFCAPLTMSMLSGTIIAAERADRSCEFLAYLPPSRTKVIVSKMFVVGGVSAVIWLSGGAALSIATMLAPVGSQPSQFVSSMPSLWMIASIGVAACGVGWMASSWLESTGGPVGLAILAPIAISAPLQISQFYFGWPDPYGYARIYMTSCATVGAVCFAVGTVYYVRRVEP